MAAAVLEGDFDFAGDANAQEEEGSGNFFAVGYRWSDRLSTELAYTDANDYKNQQFGTSKVDMWEVAALIHGGYAANLILISDCSAYRAEFRENWTEGIRGNTSEGLLWGLGLAYRLTPGGVVRLDYAPGSFGGDDLDRLMLGAVLQFSD